MRLRFSMDNVKPLLHNLPDPHIKKARIFTCAPSKLYGSVLRIHGLGGPSSGSYSHGVWGLGVGLGLKSI